MGRPMVRVSVQRDFWELVRSGLLCDEAAVAAGVAKRTARTWYRRVGGVPPVIVQPSGYRLTFADREDIACLRAEGLGVREIARRIGRPPSTVSRELRRACVGRRGYRASTAQAEADVSARRPKVRKLVADPWLCEQVRLRLSENHSPQCQQAGRGPATA